MHALRIVTQAVGSANEFTPFACKIHTTDNPVNLLLDHAFYREFCSGVPVGEHSELELLDERIWLHRHHLMIHYRTSELNGRKFVCYPGRIANITEVFRVFLIWSIRTTYTMVYGRKFEDDVDCSDVGLFLKTMEATYGIVPITCTFSLRY